MKIVSSIFGFKVLFGLAVSFGVAVLVVAAAGVPTAVQYIGFDKISATWDRGGGAILEDDGLRILAQHKRKAEEPEMHEHTNHVFMITEGAATFVTGGTMVGARKDGGNGQTWHGTRIDGGQKHQLKKGDVITIPKQTPHQWLEIPVNIKYVGVNIEN